MRRKRNNGGGVMAKASTASKSHRRIKLNHRGGESIEMAQWRRQYGNKWQMAAISSAGIAYQSWR